MTKRPKTAQGRCRVLITDVFLMERLGISGDVRVSDIIHDTKTEIYTLVLKGTEGKLLDLDISVPETPEAARAIEMTVKDGKWEIA